MKRCENVVSFVAPCQCSSPAGKKIKAPGVTVTSSFSVATIPFPSVTYKIWSNVWVWNTVAAPGLKGVLERYDATWLNQWLKSPEAFAKVDETAADLLGSNKYGLKMPTLPEMQNAQNRADMIAYLKTLKGD